MNVAVIIDSALAEPHGNHKGLSYAQLAVIWLTYILTQYDHRLSSVEQWSQEHRLTLEHATSWEIGHKDLTDDRLEDLLDALAIDKKNDKSLTPAEAIENALGQHLITAYALPTDVGRIDTTSVSVHHGPHNRDGSERKLFHFGHSKDDHRDRRQFIEALGTIDPVGIPLATATLSGESADAPIYLPIWKRMTQTIGRSDFLLVADSKLSSLSNRGQIHRDGGFYLCPLSMVGNRNALLRTWVLDPPTEVEDIVIDDKLWGHAFEIALGVWWIDESLAESDPKHRICWDERWLVIESQAFAKKQINGLEKRLNAAKRELDKLVKRPGTDLAKLDSKAQKILAQYRVTKFFRVDSTEKISYEERQIGPGRPGPKHHRKKVKVRDLRFNYSVQEDAIETEKKLAGWRIYVSNTPAGRLNLSQAAQHYRGQWQPEHGFHRFKKGMISALPIYLQVETRIPGLMLILAIALRFLTLAEYMVRKALSKEEEEGIAGLYNGNPKRKTKRPTTERMLKAFQNITLYCHTVQGQDAYEMTLLSSLQKKILRLMDIPQSIYCRPEIKDSR